MPSLVISAALQRQKAVLDSCPGTWEKCILPLVDLVHQQLLLHRPIPHDLAAAEHSALT